MAVFLQNSCKYRNCNALFPTLVELIYHIEEQHYNPNISADPSMSNLLAPPSVVRLYCLNSTSAAANANSYAFAGRNAKQKKRTALDTHGGLNELFVQPNAQTRGLSAGDMQSPYDESLIVDDDALTQDVQAFSEILSSATAPNTSVLQQKTMRPGEQPKTIIRGGNDQSKLIRTGREPPRVVRGGLTPRTGPMPTQQRTEMVFECADCPRTFATDNELRAHQKAVHESGVAVRPTIAGSGASKPAAAGGAQSSVLATFLSSGSSAMQTPQSAAAANQNGECVCPVCQRPCKNRNALSRHMRNAHSHSGVGAKGDGDVGFGAGPGYATTPSGPSFNTSGYVNVNSASSYSTQGNYVQNVNYVSSSAASAQSNYASHVQQTGYTTLNSSVAGGGMNNYAVQSSSVSYVAAPSPSNATSGNAYTVTDSQLANVNELGGVPTSQALARRTGVAQPGRIVTASTLKRKLQD